MGIKIETWKNGKVYSVERNRKGQYVKGSKRIEIGVKRKGVYPLKEERVKERNKIFRVSLAIKNVPLHSTPQKPVYYGFLIQAWSLNLEYLRSKLSGLKSKMLELMREHLISQNYVDDLKGYVSVEYPVEIIGNESLNHVWRFKVEKNGVVIDDAEGNIENL